MALGLEGEVALLEPDAPGLPDQLQGVGDRRPGKNATENAIPIRGREMRNDSKRLTRAAAE
jgi:hypothetical protein